MMQYRVNSYVATFNVVVITLLYIAGGCGCKVVSSNGLGLITTTTTTTTSTITTTTTAAAATTTTATASAAAVTDSGFATTNLPLTSSLPNPGTHPSAYQRELMKRIASRAAVASAAATKAAVNIFDEPGVRATLSSCCPHLANESADALYSRFCAEVDVAELTHNFNADRAGSWEGDMDLNLLDTAPSFYNLWELLEMNITQADQETENHAETVLMGFRPFRNSSSGAIVPRPQTFSAAADRPVYSALNLMHADVGNPLFGNVAVVFRREWATAQNTLVSPMDTGAWAEGCNKSNLVVLSQIAYNNSNKNSNNSLSSNPSPTNNLNLNLNSTTPIPNNNNNNYNNNYNYNSRLRRRRHGRFGGGFPPPVNCQAWRNPTLGTLEDYAHILVANYGLWDGPSFNSGYFSRLLWRLWGRGAAATPPLPMMTLSSPHIIYQVDKSAPPPQQQQQKQQQPCPMRGYDLISFIEPDVVAPAPLPQAVKHILAEVPYLFGTPLGARLQQVCMRRGWALLWGLGPNLADNSTGNFQHNVSMVLSGRVLDPLVADALAHFNYTALPETKARFHILWSQAAEKAEKAEKVVVVETKPTQPARPLYEEEGNEEGKGGGGGGGGARNGDNGVNPEGWRRLWHSLVNNVSTPSERTDALRAGECHDTRNCVGRSEAGECLCYKTYI